MYKFDHHRLDAFAVAKEALRLGEPIARGLPRGYSALSDQLRRALLSAFLGVAEGSSRTGMDRKARFRCACGEASEAAAALEAIDLLDLAPTNEINKVLQLLDRLCAMLTRLAGLHLTSPDEANPPSGPNSNSLPNTPSGPNSNSDSNSTLSLDPDP